MATVARRMYGPAQPGTGNATLYTATANGAVIRNIHIMNTTTADATVNIGIGATSATSANDILYLFNVPAGSSYDWSGFIALAASDTVTGLQGTSSALTVTISGIEL